jgi:hypothetical protein
MDDLESAGWLSSLSFCWTESKLVSLLESIRGVLDSNAGKKKPEAY